MRSPSGVDLAPLLDQVFDDDGPARHHVRRRRGARRTGRGRALRRRAGALRPRPHAGDGRRRRCSAGRWPSRCCTPSSACWSATAGSTSTPRPPCPSGPTRRDPRHAITLRQLLAMRDGLDFVEDYVDDRVSDVIQMLFGEGQADMAHFAADRPLAAPPGTRFNYSSGTSNIISGVVARTVGPGEDYARFLHSRLFGPLGMASADPEFDEAGTWVASSYVRATARDFARFGLLYLRDGMWDGSRGCSRPAGWTTGAPWVDRRTRRGRQTPTAPTGGACAGHAGTPARHLPRLGLRGPDDHRLPGPRPGARAPGQDAARA